MGMNTPEVDTERLRDELSAHLAPRGGGLKEWYFGLGEAEQAYVASILNEWVAQLMPTFQQFADYLEVTFTPAMRRVVADLEKIFEGAIRKAP